MSETALLLYAAARISARPARIDALIGAAARELAPLARADAVMAAMMLRPALTTELSVPHLCLTRLGLPDPGFDEGLRAVCASPRTRLLERAPWKDLEAGWISALGAPLPGIDTRPALDRTLLATGLDALSARREDLYAFTHGLIYLTDFGHAAAPGLPRPAEEIAEDAETALGRALDDDDFDVAAELLLTWPYLRLDWSASAAFAVSLLARLEDLVGVLPSLSLRADAYESLDHADRTRYVTAEAYHTAYVMALLSAALLLPDATRPEAAPHSARRGAAKTLLTLLPPRTPTPHWETSFRALPAAQRERLAPLLVSVGLRRAFKSSDLAAAARLLAAAVELRLPLTPAVVQGAELLARLAGRAPA